MFQLVHTLKILQIKMINLKELEIRNLLNELEKEGLDKKKFLLTINNLKSARRSNEVLYKKKFRKKCNFLKKSDKSLILKKIFLNNLMKLFLDLFQKLLE